MDQRALYLELAGCWQRAAYQTTNESLRSCYTERAARYLDMAARRARQAPALAPQSNDGAG
jgi:hypothetical protein